MKTKVFIVYSKSESLGELNSLLESGWKVKEVHPSQGSEHAVWLVVAIKTSE